MKRLDVTCAIIEKEGRVLVVRRSKTMSLPLKWEFPGGKVNKGETEEESIIREIKEELELDIKISKKLNSSIFDYPNMSIKLIPFIAEQVGGRLRLNEHAAFKYLVKDDLMSLDWAEADIPIVKEYLDL